MTGPTPTTSTNPLAQFERFILAGDSAAEMRTEFQPVLRNAAFSKDNDSLARVLASHRKMSGIYFWVLRHGTDEYKLYIGQTKSLANRLLNYVSEFQAHSPNDYKLRIFAAFLTELAPRAVLDLYFAVKEVGDLKDAERIAIRQYRPLLNELPPPSIEAKQRLREAFEFYYRSAFQGRLDRK